MAQYRDMLPQLTDALFLTDAGMETTLIFHQGVELPHFASFVLMDSKHGRRLLADYYARFFAIVRDSGLGLVLDTPTWRANRDWGAKLGYGPDALDDVNRRAASYLAALRADHETPGAPIVVSGTIGPRGDGYQAGEMMSATEAEDYHAPQIASFAASEADMLGAWTLTYPQEAIGIARAATAAGMPVSISFTLETDGRLPCGMSLKQAIELTDAATGQAPAYYMINCAHPTHFAGALEEDGDWIFRLKGVRANASKRSHAELDAAPELDAGDPVELGRQYRALLRRHRHFSVFGGCCGTDHRHLEQIKFACTAADQLAA